MDRPKHSGFEAPCIGVVMPRGTRIVKNPDGTISHVIPEEAKPDKETAPERQGHGSDPVDS